MTNNRDQIGHDMTTDHTCNAGCARCVRELDPDYWMKLYQVVSHQSDTYRDALIRILAHFPHQPAMHWMGNPYIETTHKPTPHDLLDAIQDARRLLTDG